MELDAELLHRIRDIVQKHHAAFAVSVFGGEVVPPEVLEALQKEGLLEGLEDVLEQTYTYGQLMARLESPKAEHWSLNRVNKELAERPIVLTGDERRALSVAKLKAASYVTGLGDRVSTGVSGALAQADHEHRVRMREEVTEAVSKRKSLSALKSALGHATQDWARDLDRVAITEKHNAFQEGYADGLRSRYGDDVMVSVVPRANACPHCRRLHLGPDGQPRIVPLSHLAPPGANVGRKAADWVAVNGSIHPNCQCRVTRVPVGWGWSDEGELVPGGAYGHPVEPEEKPLKKSDPQRRPRDEVFTIPNPRYDPVAARKAKGKDLVFKAFEGQMGAELKHPEGGFRGANLQAGGPRLAVNPHDVHGINAYLHGLTAPSSDVIIRRDPELYTLGEGTNWVWDIGEAEVRDAVYPDKEREDIDTNRFILERRTSQDHTENRNYPVPIGPIQTEAKPRYPIRKAVTLPIRTAITMD